MKPSHQITADAVTIRAKGGKGAIEKLAEALNAIDLEEARP